MQHVWERFAKFSHVLRPAFGVCRKVGDFFAVVLMQTTHARTLWMLICVDYCAGELVGALGVLTFVEDEAMAFGLLFGFPATEWWAIVLASSRHDSGESRERKRRIKMYIADGSKFAWTNYIHSFEAKNKLFVWCSFQGTISKITKGKYLQQVFRYLQRFWDMTRCKPAADVSRELNLPQLDKVDQIIDVLIWGQKSSLAY